MRTLRYALVLSSLFGTGCFELRVKSQGQSIPLDGSTKVAKTSQISSEKVVAEFRADSTFAHKVEAPSASTLRGASVILPPGALQISTGLVLEEAISLQETSLVSELGLSTKVELSTASTGMIIRPTADVQLTQPMTLRMTLPSSLTAWLFGTNNYVVFYKQFKDGGLVSGIIPSDKVTFVNEIGSDAYVLFDGYFGAYWVVKVEDPILEQIEVTSSEPIINSANISVIEQDGIVTEEKVLEKVKLPEIVWNEVSLSLQQGRSLLLTSSVSALEGLSSCRADFGRTQSDLNTITIETDTSLSVPFSWKIVEESTAIGRFRCLDSAGRLTTSPWSKLLTVPAKSLIPLSLSLSPLHYAQTNYLLSPVVEGATQYEWSLVSGPGSLTFSSASTAQTTVQASLEGTYSIRFRIANEDGESQEQEIKLIWDTTAPTSPSQVAFAMATSHLTTQALNWISSSDSHFKTHEVKVCSDSLCSANCRSSLTAVSSPLSLTLLDGDLIFACVRGLDLAGNGSPWIPSSSLRIDTSSPTIQAISSSLADGFYDVGAVIPLTLTFSEPVTSADPAAIRIMLNASALSAAQYQSGNGTASWLFHYTVEVGDATHDLNTTGSLLALTAASIPSDSLGNHLVNALPDPSGPSSLAAQKNFTVWTLDPEPPLSLGFSQATSNSRTISYSWNTGSSPYITQNLTYVSHLSDCSSQTTSPQTIPSSSQTVKQINLQVPEDGIYYACVQNKNELNRSSTLLSSLNPILVDATPPPAPTSVSITSTSTYSQGEVIWSGATSDALGSFTFGVNLCQTTCGSSTGCSVEYVTPTIGALLSAPATGSYYACVRTYDQLGNMSAWVQSSNAIPLTNSDTTAPTLSNPQLTLQSQANSHVSISWTAAQDNVTAPADMLYSVYLLPGQCSASTVFNEYQKIAAIQGTTFSISLPFELSFCFGVQAEDEAGLTISYNPAHILHTAPSLGSSLQVGNLGSSSQRKVFFEPTTQTHIAIFAKEQSLTVMRSSNGQTWSLAEELATPQIRDFSATVGTVGSSQFLYIIWSDGNGDILGRRAQFQSPASLLGFSTTTLLYDGSSSSPFEKPTLALSQSASPKLYVGVSQRLATLQHQISYRQLGPDFSVSGQSAPISLLSLSLAPTDLSLVADDQGGAYFTSNSHQIHVFSIDNAGTPTAVPQTTLGWEGFPNKSVSGTVSSVVSSPDGSLLVAGRFSLVDSQGRTAHNIARWMGQQWYAIGEGSRDAVQEVLVSSQGTPFIRGYEQNSFGKSFVRYWNGIVWKDLPLHLELSLPNAPNAYQSPGVITSFHFDSSGDLWLGGAFTSVKTPLQGTLSSPGLLSWNLSTQLVTPRGLPAGDNGPLFVQSMSQTPQKLYVSALEVFDYNLFMTQQKNYLMCPSCLGMKPPFPSRLLTWNGSWSEIGIASELPLLSQLVAFGEDLYLLGYKKFMIKPSPSLPNQEEVFSAQVYRLLSSGTLTNLSPAHPCQTDSENGVLVNRWCQMGNLFHAKVINNTFYLSLQPTSAFASSSYPGPLVAMSPSDSQILYLDANGNWQTFATVNGGPIMSMASSLSSPPHLILGGAFAMIGNTPVNALAKIDLSTSPPSLPIPYLGTGATGPNGPIRKLSAGPAGQILFAGRFQQIGDSSSPFIGVYTSQGFSALPGLSSEPLAVEVNPQGLYYIATTNGYGFQIQRRDGQQWITIAQASGLLSRLQVSAQGKLFVTGNDLKNLGDYGPGHPAMVLDPSAGSSWTYLGPTYTQAHISDLSPSEQFAFVAEPGNNLYKCSESPSWTCEVFGNLLPNNESLSLRSLLWNAQDQLFGAGSRFFQGAYISDVVTRLFPGESQWSLLLSSSGSGQTIGTGVRLVADSANPSSPGFYLFSIPSLDQCSFLSSPTFVTLVTSTELRRCRVFVDYFNEGTNTLTRSYWHLPQSLLSWKEIGSDSLGTSAVNGLAVVNQMPLIAGDFHLINGFPASFFAIGRSQNGWNGYNQGISTAYDTTHNRLTLFGARQGDFELRHYTSTGTYLSTLPESFYSFDGVTQLNLSLREEADAPYAHFYYIEREQLIRKKYNLTTQTLTYGSVQELLSFSTHQLAVPASPYAQAGSLWETLLTKSSVTQGIKALQSGP